MRLAHGPGWDEMRAAIEAVLDLHQPCDTEQIEPDGGAIWGKVCVECGSDSIGSWPCPTVRAIAEKLAWRWTVAANPGGCRADCPPGFHYHTSYGVTAQSATAAYQRGDWTVPTSPARIPWWRRWRNRG